MDARFDPEKGDIYISFELEEVEDCAFLLQLVFEGEHRKRTPVPNMDASFFERLAVIERKKWIWFSYDYLEFVTVFLTEAREVLIKNGDDPSTLEKLMDEVQKWRFGEWYPKSYTVH